MEGKDKGMRWIQNRYSKTTSTFFAPIATFSYSDFANLIITSIAFAPRNAVRNFSRENSKDNDYTN